ncbi:MAG: M1 family aminopeptidase, partial [candidate division KSB1 bacterium]
GDTLAFAQEPKEAGVTVFLPEAAWLSDTLRLFMQYEGEALRRSENGTLFLKDAINWVPRWGYLARAQYHLVFKCSPRWRVLSVGERVRDWDEPSFHLSFYKTREPAKASTFCLGRFEADTLALLHANLPRIEIHSTPRRSARDRRRVAGDIANSLHFYERLLAPYPLESIRVVESPSTHSQGFPGFVTLSWVGFASQLSGPIEALRSHEVAHQWFGNLLGWATYHDQWLSEAFAEYLGALYVEWTAREPEAFDQLLAAWRDDILDGGHIGVSLGMQRFGLGKEALRKAEGMKAGPLWLGYRLGQNEAVDYYTHVYEKGAYVLHMLRELMRDLSTESDAKFWNMLADFLRQYGNREPATEDFQRVAEAHYGAPLDWFFRQWLYRSEAPTYRWRYEIAPELEPPQVGLPVAQGAVAPFATTHVLRVKVRQEGVSRDFKMPVPVTVEYADGTSATQRVWVTHAGGEIEWPLRSSKVLNVWCNRGNAVLARVRHEEEN